MATVLKGLDPQAFEVFIVRRNGAYFPTPPSLTDLCNGYTFVISQKTKHFKIIQIIFNTLDVTHRCKHAA
jgi:hypothetical protein